MSSVEIVQENEIVDWSTLIDLVVELLSVFIEQIMYYRRLYPPESFKKVKSFQLAVYMNRHPGVRTYLTELASRLRKLLSDGILYKIFLEVSKEGSVLETFSLNFEELIVLKTVSGSKNLKGKDVSLQTVNAELRSLLFSVITELQKMEQPLKDTSFNILVGTTDSAVTVNSSNFSQMAIQNDWILHKRVGTITHEHAASSLSFFKEVDIGFASVKGFCAVHGKPPDDITSSHEGG